ncbi:MAG: hypothetical protein H0U75_03860 [Legionella sp.]|nr:hypothetical protein [Legionella sp.]
MEKYSLTKHEIPRLHENGATISFENCYKLGKIYKQIIGDLGVHHFSINVVDESGKMTILSYNPQIAYNIFKDGSYIFNGSISKTFYGNQDFYTWDETYTPSYYHFMKNNMERKHGIDKGLVIVKRQQGLTLLYSFATKHDGDDFVIQAQEQLSLLYAMGDHCFDQISPMIHDRIIGFNVEENLSNSGNIIRFPSRG